MVDVTNVSLFIAKQRRSRRIITKALRQQEEDIKTWEGHIKNYPEAEHFKTT